MKKRLSEEGSSIAILTLCLSCFIACFFVGLSFSMDTIINVRLSYYALPAAISWIYHGIAFDHSAYSQIADLFSQAHPNVVDDTFLKAISLTDIDRGRIALFPADDKGPYELAIFSILVFGPHVSSLYFGVVLLLGVSATCFAVQFRNDQTALNMLALFFLALLVAMPAFAVTKELYSLSNPRVFGVMAVIPLLHIAFTLGRRLTWQLSIVCAMQSLLLIQCLHIRSTEAWVFIALFLITCIFLRRHPIKGAWPAGIAFAALALLPLYQSATYHADYFGSNIRGRLFWHNVGIGLSLSPKLSQRYGLTFSDSFATVVAQKARRERGDKFTQEVFGKSMEWVGEFKDARAYEILARDFVLQVVKENPVETFKLFVFTKPKVFVKTLYWLYGKPVDQSSIYVADQIGSLATPEERVISRIYWRPFALPIVFCLVVLILMRGRLLLLPVGIAFACSLIAPIVTYPVVHTLAVSLLLLTMLILGLVVKGGTGLLGAISHRNRKSLQPSSAPS